MRMKIEKIINNNIVASKDRAGKELIVMGRGLGYGKKVGEKIEENNIEKIFRLEKEDSIKGFEELVKKLPLEYIKISGEIISYARATLGKELNENVYLTLTDHISFAIDRFKEGIIFNNALFEEIKVFYPNEYLVGCHALYLIEEQTGIRLLEDEAASIALHIVNAELNSAIGMTFAFTQMMRDMMQIIMEQLPDLVKESEDQRWLAINLKYLAYRMMAQTPRKVRQDVILYDFVRKHCVSEYQLISGVNDFIKEKYDCSMTEEEKIYLSLGIRRIKDFHTD